MANKTENLPSHQIHYSFFSRRCFLCDRGKFTVWYGTNRRPIDPTNPSMDYGPERDIKEVHYGAVKIFIPASHKIGSTGSSWWRRLLRHCAFLIAMLPNIDFAGGHLNHGLGDDRGRSRLHLPCLAVRQRYQNLRLCRRRRALIKRRRSPIRSFSSARRCRQALPLSPEPQATAASIPRVRRRRPRPNR